VKLWIDAQLSPALASWLRSEFLVDAIAVRDLGLRDASDEEIFEAARKARAVVLTKDADFALILERVGPPPQVIWLRCGNTSNDRLKVLLRSTFAKAIELVERDEALVSITDPV
jgi:predicted nuclease of predicted toxin-antitoxin system